jgi:maleamate amidohydrolase
MHTKASKTQMSTRRSSQVVDQHTLDTYERAGFGGTADRGTHPAVLVVDFSYGFTEASSPTGSDMSGPIAATGELLAVARGLGVPVIFTTIAYCADEVDVLPWLQKAPGLKSLLVGTHPAELDARLHRRPNETVLIKTGASAFFGTPLATLLAAQCIDTLIVTGATTSGCVRASVVDAVQYGYPTLVPWECVADRAQPPHDASLFDMNEKYADVVGLADVLAYLRSLPGAAARRSGRSYSAAGPGPSLTSTDAEVSA